jgi:ribose/xylose/arabinose/galactoside ABC-type transport system permease subunit
MNQPQLNTSPVKRVSQMRRWVEILLDNSLLLATVILVIFFTIFAGNLNFFTFGNLVNILLIATLNGLFACGLTITMLAGNIDFSSTGGTAIASILVGVVFQKSGVPLLPSILIVIGAAVLVGLLTSTLIVNFKIPGLVATIAVNGAYVALAMALCGNMQINVVRVEMQQFWMWRGLLGIPLTVWVMFASFLAAFIMLNYTAHIYATGANYNAARLNGVPVENVIRITLVLSAVFIAIGGMVATARSGITILFGSTNALNTADAFLAVLLGGVALFGGSGKIEQIFLAILFLAVLFNGLSLMALPTGVWFVIRGVAYLLAILLGVARTWAAQTKA